jgi:hypothetical protein
MEVETPNEQTFIAMRVDTKDFFKLNSKLFSLGCLVDRLTAASAVRLRQMTLASKIH